MPFNITSYFKLERFLSLQPAIALSTIYFLVAIFGGLLIMALIIKLTKKITHQDSFFKKLLQKYFVMLMTMSLLGLMLTWFRYERVYILSARFLLLVWFLGMAVWLVYILKYQFKVMPQERIKLQKTQEFNKYLPKRK
ncbi:MAG: hypothetical protein COU81_02660 [Candidatus Portnoybacteria bacterium CG10_big_fil_rev_8_21_14_0_10_36_7]|uniref:Uncharacterized protein n=1 Tax=Candidatus Portnoybacteria bacterium CG10_big_fil_rev_8_21_14_0_10_36_7 TaxID=1974812 RepID=A0A2M8KDU3_9BACT|nr:MAG: hypothetical protein COU81_02660 [Candidatus Portnoybacteria bacterium CG10_big_fil_rev_8_21_14_0_10_36_7]